ncbi:AI-2E family transporter [Salinisphaera sp. Q1T1-3]|uniref:AI-2E family transporter n=1 Tax=Salinisphaera sp. Q1T1-3 TaxID=2321229 RepID=UPI000E71FEFB|nr:AI-2E family transporter [Salinisphaera sp. Q1T1-3]RJS94421.1 AI-2E family transporter [Salinisphaera sp. Q1T1-3]
MRGRTLAAIGLAVLVAAVVLLHSVLLPFVLGAGLAYVCDPMVDRLERFRLGRTGGVIVVFLGMTLIGTLAVFLILPILQAQFETLLRNIPRYIDWVQNTLNPWIQRIAPGAGGIDAGSIQRLIANNWGSASGVATTIARKAFSSGTALFSWAITLLLVPVIMFYLLRDWDRMTAFVREQMPRRYVGTITELARETDDVLGHFIRGQLLVMAVLGAIYVIGLWLAGLDLALVIGLGAGLISFVPYVGVLSGVSMATLAMLVQTGDPVQIVWVLIVFAIGQVMEQMVLTPLVLGREIGLHPVWVIFAVLAGGQLFGFIGVLLALPAASAIAVLVRYGGRRWRESRLYLQE